MSITFCFPFLNTYVQYFPPQLGHMYDDLIFNVFDTIDTLLLFFRFLLFKVFSS